MGLLGRLFARWRRGSEPIGSANAWANVLIGAACLALTGLDVRLGLGTYGRWMLGLPFGLLPLGWGLAALWFCRRRETARPLRLAGDVLLWAGLVLFTLLGLFAADGETGPLVTLAR